jgi:hypothetical protein
VFAAHARDEEGVPWKPRHVRQLFRVGQSGWQVRASTNKKSWHFGVYNERAHAARAADRAALVVFGEHTPLNLPGLLTAEERRVLSAVVDVDTYAEECRRAAPRAQPPKCCEYIGVCLPPGHSKFQAGVRVCERTCYLGSFADSEDAARAYDVAPASSTFPPSAKCEPPFTGVLMSHVVGSCKLHPKGSASFLCPAAHPGLGPQNIVSSSVPMRPLRIPLIAMQALHERIRVEQASGALPLPTDFEKIDITGFRKLLIAIRGLYAPFASTRRARRGK